MKDHVPGVVVEGEVVFGQGGLAGVEGGLVAEGVVTVAQGGGHVDYGAEHREIMLVKSVKREESLDTLIKIRFKGNIICSNDKRGA